MAPVRSYLIALALLAFTLRDDDHHHSRLLNDGAWEDLDFESDTAAPRCSLNESEIALSAYNRSKMDACKRRIHSLYCQHANLKLLQDSDTGLYKLRLKRDNARCSKHPRSSKYLACVRQEDFLANSNETTRKLADVKEQQPLDLELCLDVCLRYHRYAAWRREAASENRCMCFGKELFDRLSSSLLVFDENACERPPAPTDAYYIYKTGFIAFAGESRKPSNTQTANRSIGSIIDEFERKAAKSTDGHNELPRIVFLFTLNGRSVRQVSRLIKSVYRPYHFYYIHVDQRMVFLRAQLVQLQKQLEAKHVFNLRVTDWSMKTLWGSPVLLQMHLRAMQDLLDIKTRGFKSQDGRHRARTTWNWDFLLNLSESDFPIKSVEELTLYLASKRGLNFLKFHSNSESLVKKQGLEYAFVQCEEHIWKVTERPLLYGIQYGGGSDWFGLTAEFIGYVLHSRDEYLLQLRKIFRYSLLPSETFFHIVALNSPFCDKFVNSNLKFINWDRKQGCGCPNKELVDWCGCSPSLLANSQWESLKALKQKPVFFARKFDQLFANQLINRVDQSIYGLYSPDFKSLSSYWENLVDQTDHWSIESKHRTVFGSLAAWSMEILKQRASAVGSKDLYQQASQLVLLSASNNSLLSHVVHVSAFFQADSFRGFVVGLKAGSTEFEVLFVPSAKQSLVNVVNSTDKSVEKLLKSIISFQVSTNFNAREQQFRSNYASLISQHDRPVLVLEVDPLDEDAKLGVKLFDPSGNWIKQTNFNLNKSNETKLILSQLFSPRQNSTIADGIWKIELGLVTTTTTTTTTDNNNLEDDDNKNKSQFHSLLSYKFLVISELGADSARRSLLAKFWKVGAFCVKQSSSSSVSSSFLEAQLMPNCTSEASYWSSWYSDPKSNIFDLVTSSLRSHRLG